MKTITNIFEWAKYWYTYFRLISTQKRIRKALNNRKEDFKKIGISTDNITIGFIKDCSEDK